jgi:hypothetical protein
MILVDETAVPETKRHFSKREDGKSMPSVGSAIVERAMGATHVADIMTSDVTTLKRNENLTLADDLMNLGRIRHPPCSMRMEYWSES